MNRLDQIRAAIDWLERVEFERRLRVRRELRAITEMRVAHAEPDPEPVEETYSYRAISAPKER